LLAHTVVSVSRGYVDETDVDEDGKTFPRTAGQHRCACVSLADTWMRQMWMKMRRISPELLANISVSVSRGWVDDDGQAETTFPRTSGQHQCVCLCLADTWMKMAWLRRLSPGLLVDTTREEVPGRMNQISMSQFLGAMEMAVSDETDYHRLSEGLSGSGFLAWTFREVTIEVHCGLRPTVYTPRQMAVDNLNTDQDGQKGQ
ncbi:hypothetical protein BaRGS_00007920, partial [Batillaria attramentaria]